MSFPTEEPGRPSFPRTEDDLRPGSESGSPPDPLRFCVLPTVVVIAWVTTPAFAAMVLGGLGVAAYLRAWRSGLRRSRCKLGDARLVMDSLGVVALAGAVVTVADVRALLLG